MRVVILDSSSVIHRCFHGYPARPATFGAKGHGIDVAALGGYVEYIRTLDREFEFDLLIHVLDPEGGSRHRQAIYPAYKATRPTSHPALTVQKLLLPQALAAFGQRFLQIPGVESDDVMGTLATAYAREGHMVAVISPDKDMLQLVDNEAIHIVHRVERGNGMQGKDHTFINADGVRQKLGINPNQVADYLALMGDSSDNIPGVMDVGPKTAADWLKEHGNLASLMTQAQATTPKGEFLIKGKRGDNLRAALGHLPLSRQLTTLLLDVPIDRAKLEEEPIIDATAHAQWRELLQLPAYVPDRLYGADDAPGQRTVVVSSAVQTSAVQTSAVQTNETQAVIETRATVVVETPVAPVDPNALRLGDNDPFAELDAALAQGFGSDEDATHEAFDADASWVDAQLSDREALAQAAAEAYDGTPALRTPAPSSSRATPPTPAPEASGDQPAIRVRSRSRVL